MNYHLTRVSSNAKTGPIPVSTTSAKTCPPSCPFSNGGGCYAGGGPLAIHWGKVTRGERGGSLEAFTAQISALPHGTIWRHNQAGDLPGEGEGIDADALRQIVDANRGKKGFTYTHKKPSVEDNASTIAEANAKGFAVNLSANTLDEVDKLLALGIGPVVVVLPTDGTTTTTPRGAKVVQCPATIEGATIQCATCGGAKGPLCGRIGRKFAVGFPAHGTGKKRAEKVAKGQGA